METFEKHLELPYGEQVQTINMSDFMTDFRVPGDKITVDEEWLQKKLQTIYKLEIENKNLQRKRESDFRNLSILKGRIETLNTTVEVMKIKSTPRTTRVLDIYS